MTRPGLGLAARSRPSEGRHRRTFRQRAFGMAEAVVRAVPSAILFPAALILVLGSIVHLVSILALPALAERNAYQRLSAIAGINRMTILPDPGADGMTLPMMDPAFVTAVCVYDLSDHPLKVLVPPTYDYTSVSFYTTGGVAFYALSDQAAGRIIELDLLSPTQRAALPEDEEITAADRLVVESLSQRGIVVVRAFARYPDMRPAVRRQLEAARCESVT